MNRRALRSKAFTLVELIVVVVVLGILASIAIVGYKTVVDKSLEAKQKMRMTQILKEAKILYTQRVYTDTAYPWNQAVADAVDDLPTYSLNAWSEGVSAYNGSNLNTATNGWTVQTDTGSGVYSVAPNDIVVSTSGAGIVYVASALSSTQGVFGMISATTAPVVWTASCSTSTCDASSATSGPPAGGAYAAGTTAAPTYAFGSTGPGGGTIIAVFATPFACGPSRSLSCTYLEAAPNSWYAPGEDPLRDVSGHTINNLTVTNTGLGYGYQNTLTLLAQNSTANKAVTLADAYTNNGQSDWFLPSKVELNEFCKYARQQSTGDTSVICNGTGSLRAGIGSAWWWSSSAESPWAWRQHTINGTQINDANVTPNQVRPMRAG